MIGAHRDTPLETSEPLNNEKGGDMKTRWLLGTLGICIFTIRLSFSPRSVRGENKDRSGHVPTKEVYIRAQGQDDFIRAISHKKLGSFSLDGQVGRDLRFVKQSQTEKGRKITILFERWLRLFEVKYGTRSQD